jgi:hypothetical protein
MVSRLRVSPGCLRAPRVRLAILYCLKAAVHDRQQRSNSDIASQPSLDLHHILAVGRARMTGAPRVIKPPSGAPLLRTVPGRGLPTVTQYFLNPLGPDGGLGSQHSDELSCGAVRVVLRPYFADADSSCCPLIPDRILHGEALPSVTHALAERAQPEPGSMTR